MSTPYSWAVPGALCACVSSFEATAHQCGLQQWPLQGMVYTVRAVQAGTCVYHRAHVYLLLEELHVSHRNPCGCAQHEVGWLITEFRPVRKPSIDVLTQLLAPGPLRQQLNKIEEFVR